MDRSELESLCKIASGEKIIDLMFTTVDIMTHGNSNNMRLYLDDLKELIKYYEEKFLNGKASL